MVLRSPADLDTCLERLGLPLIVKPATQGSSVGMTKVEKAEQLLGAFQAAALLEPNVFAEPWITGAEYTVAVLQGRALPSIRIETPATFYDYQAKYFRNDTKYFCPSGLSAEAEKHLASLALATFAAVGAEGWGRADFMMDKTGRPYLLEINTVPGMTDHSLVPMAARALDISFEQLVWQVLETSFAAPGSPHDLRQTQNRNKKVNRGEKRPWFSAALLARLGLIASQHRGAGDRGDAHARRARPEHHAGVGHRPLPARVAGGSRTGGQGARARHGPDQRGPRGRAPRRRAAPLGG